MTGNGTIPSALDGVLGQLHEMVPQIESGIAEIEEKRRGLRASITQLDQEERRLRGLLKHLQPKEAKRTGRRSQMVHVGSKALRNLITAALEQEGLFSPIALHRERGWDWSEPHTYQAAAYLRAEEVLGLAGKEPDPPYRKLFRVLDRVKASQLLEDIDQIRAGRPRGRESVSG